MAKLFNPNSETMCNILMKRNHVSGLLVELKDHNKEAYEHSIRVGELSTDIGFENGFDESEIMHLCYSGLLHDIGKTCIFNGILNNSGDLTLYQMNIIRKHTSIGFDILRKKELYPEAFVALTHHRYKKDPYPDFDIAVPDESKELAEIVAAADIFDAIRNKRSYKEAFPCGDVEKIMKKEYTGNPKYIKQVLDRCV